MAKVDPEAYEQKNVDESDVPAEELTEIKAGEIQPRTKNEKSVKYERGEAKAHIAAADTKEISSENNLPETDPQTPLYLIDGQAVPLVPLPKTGDQRGKASKVMRQRLF